MNHSPNKQLVRADLAAIYNCCRLECQVKFKNACAAAGINLTVES